MADARYGAEPESGDLSRWQQVAVIMVSLGQDLAAELMRQFNESEVEEITRAIADLKTVSQDQKDEVLLELDEQLRRGDLPTQGGEVFARGLLEQAVGPERAEELWGRLGGASGSGFVALNRADPSQVAPYIGREHPQTIALIMSQIDPAQAAAILQKLPAAVQADVTHRIATLERVSPEILAQVEESLIETLGAAMAGELPVEGTQVAADILNRIGSSLEHRVLDQLDAADPEVAESVRSRMFTFDDVARLGEAEIRLLLEQVEIKELMVALKSAGKGVLDTILKTMSQRRQQQILEDMAVLPRMRLSEVEAAQTNIIQQMRQLEEQGVIRLPKGDEDEQFVD